MHLISNLNIGGAQTDVLTLAKYQVCDKSRLVVCTFKDGPLRHEIERSGIPVEIVPDRRYSIVALPWFVLDMIRIRNRLVGLIKKYEIDVVQTHLLGCLDFLVLTLLFTTSLRIVLWTFHNTMFELTATQLPKYSWMLEPKKAIYRFLYRWASHWVSGLIAVSDDVKKAIVDIIGPIGNKITVICNGVDISRYQQMVDKALIKSQIGLETNCRLIAVVATLKEQKGHRYLIEAMTSIAPLYPDVHVLFIGEGDLQEALQFQVKEADLNHRIHFLGNRCDVPALLAASDLFILPSLWEGLSMALLEAMASGLPVIATEVSGTAQVMVPNETGIMVLPGDAMQLAQAIAGLLADPVRAQRMGLAARQRVEMEFSGQRQADQHLALYRCLLQRKNSFFS